MTLEPIFMIEQIATGVILFDGVARDEAHALELMSGDAGYADYSEACACQGKTSDEGRAELKITSRV